MSGKKLTCSLERLVSAYLRPRIYMMFLADSKNKIRSQSSHADDIIARHYESLPLSHQEALLNDYKRMQLADLKELSEDKFKRNGKKE